MAKTGATLEWLATGHGNKFDGESIDLIRVPKYKLVEGQLYDEGSLKLDKATFPLEKSLPKQPMSIAEGSRIYVIETELTEIFDGDWLHEIEGKSAIRTLTRIPVKRVRVSGNGSTAFDSGIDDIRVIGRVILTIING